MDGRQFLVMAILTLFSLVDESRSQQPPPSEATNLTKAKLCIPGNEQSINHCKNALSAEVTAHFHPEKKLTILTSSCVYVSNGPPVKGANGQPTSPIRCSMHGYSLPNPDEQEDLVTFHFFNDNKAPGDGILVEAYFGDDKQPKLTETPL
ncbi:hypothetical protein M8J77_001473 [Diaphorina citri]|nr:hypothetical protein M8J77_001473 [Diaphorina citri]